MIYTYCQSLFLKLLMFLNALTAQTNTMTTHAVTSTQIAAHRQNTLSAQRPCINSFIHTKVEQRTPVESFIKELHDFTAQHVDYQDIQAITQKIINTNRSDKITLLCLLLQLKSTLTKKIDTQTKQALESFIKTLNFAKL